MPRRSQSAEHAHDTPNKIGVPSNPPRHLQLKTISLKVSELPMPVVMPLNGNISRMPTSAPSSESSSDSNHERSQNAGPAKIR